ncbi:MAG: RuBisCO large subunit C-terminal-like domain-containing protein [Promethearchaeota archaeon]
MLEVENWEFFPEQITLPIVECNRYDAYGLKVPDPELIDEAMRTRLGPYLLDSVNSVDFEKFRQKYIIMYVSISPKLREGWSLRYGLFRAALEIAAEESTGTWDPDLKTIVPGEMDEQSQANMKILPAKIIGLNFFNGMAAIALPVEGFELGNIPQLLSVIMGNYTGMSSAAWGVRLEDVDFPDSYVNEFPGPALGNDGIKELLGDQISVGTIVKPKTGLSEADWAKAARRSFEGGLDIVKDDENLTSQDYCTFEKRAQLVLNECHRITNLTGRKLVYVANITHGDIDEMIRRGELIRSLGGNCLMIDILSTGISGVQTIRKKFPHMILHGHRAGHGAQTIFPEIKINGQPMDFRHGISMKVWTLIARLAGIDQFHIGAPLGKMEATSHTVLENLEACTRPLGHIKTMRPICSGGLKSTVLWDVAKVMNPNGDKPNQDIICQAGGGTHSHPLGTFAGAKSMVQARDAVKNKIGIFETISNHFETLLAFRRWDRATYAKWVENLTESSKVVVTPDLRIYFKNGQYREKGPEPVNLQQAVKIFPALVADLRRWNPSLADNVLFD